MTPNAGPSLENIIFDPTLYGLTAVVASVALGAALFALRNRRLEPSWALGTGLIALGYSATIIVAISLLALVRVGQLGGFLYLQAEFGAAYTACLSIMYGVDKVMFSPHGPSMRKAGLRAALWSVFFVSVGLAVVFLLDPSTYTVTTVGGTQHVAQEAVFWLPPFVTMIAGAVGLSAVVVHPNDLDARIRTHAIWLASFFILCIVGVLRESNTIPSIGDPLADMLMAFVPFTAGSLCLLISATTLHQFKTV